MDGWDVDGFYRSARRWGLAEKRVLTRHEADSIVDASPPDIVTSVLRGKNCWLVRGWFQV